MPTTTSPEPRETHAFVVCDALEKVFLDAAPRPHAPVPLSSFVGERASFQLAWLPPTSSDLSDLPRLTFLVDAGPGARVDLSLTRSVPVQLPVPAGHDDEYLRTSPGLYPDLLEPLPQGARRTRSVLDAWQALWVDLVVDDPELSGPRTVRVSVLAHPTDEPWPAATDGSGPAEGGGEVVFEAELEWVVRGHRLPELDITVTQWMHPDALADRYRVETFGEEHWRIVEAHLRSLRAMGCNAVLTPLFTAPLDVREGQHRRRCQLLGIRHSGVPGTPYELDVTLLDRWVDCCVRQGLTTLEMPPLFTQWGAASAAPWWVRTTAGDELVFGWHVPATAPEYRSFLAEVLPAVIEHLSTAWPQVAVVWHVSDEPGAERLEAYRAARAVVADLLTGQTVVDAVSDPAFAASGAMSTPVVATDAVESFRGVVEDFWVYYCNAQHRGLANRFIAMPGVRTRVLGRQLFAAGAQGFLHWGFDYWYAQLSEHPVDPHQDTTAGGAFPGGDAFVVYPGPDGVPWESVRHRQVRQGVEDHRALQLLRDLTGRRTVPTSGAPTASAPERPADPFDARGLDPVEHLRWRWRLDEAIDAAAGC